MTLAIHGTLHFLQESTVKPTPMSKIFRMGRETWHFLLAGLVASIVSGLVTPFFAIVYSQIFAVSTS